METKFLGRTGIDPTQYGMGEGVLYTEQVYKLVNGITCFHGLAYKSGPYRDYNLLKNPLKYRYEENKALMSNPTIVSGPGIGQRANPYENIGRQIVFLDEAGGISGYTQLAYASGETGDALHDTVTKAYNYNRFDIEGNPTTDIGAIIPEYGDKSSNIVDGPSQMPLNGEEYKYTPVKYRGSTVTPTLPAKRKTLNQYDEVKSGGFTDTTQTLFDGVAKVTPQSGSLLQKTNDLFRRGKINTLINRFSTVDSGPEGEKPTPGTLNTAMDKTYGFSRGRNLLKDTPNSVNGYTNPYCRVWTSHAQMAHYKDLIRPMYSEKGVLKIEDMQKTYGKYWRPHDGNTRLSNNSVIDEKNGLVKYTPYSDDFDSNFKRDKNAIKRCMFSIENLAWKDVEATEPVFEISSLGTTEEKVKQGNKSSLTYKNLYSLRKLGSKLSKEQTGPFGGRIMWFPPYDLSFNETVNVEWEPTDFIGRGEKIYTYKNTDRSGQLDFTILIDHPMVIDPWVRENPDDSVENEEKILRFFAGCGNGCGDGCGNLELNPVDDDEIIDNELIINTGIEEHIVSPEDNPIAPYENKLTLIMPVFFPNGYSALDYLNEDSSVGLKYMLSSMGAQGYETVVDTQSGRKGIYFPVDSGRYKYHTKYPDTRAYGLNTENLRKALAGEDSQAIDKEMKERIFSMVPIDDNGGDGINKDVISFNEFIDIVKSKEDLLKYMAEKALKSGSTEVNINNYVWDISAEINGFASSHGDEKNNEGLFMTRAKMLKKVLVERKIFEENTDKLLIVSQTVDSNIQAVAQGPGISLDTSHYVAKLGRHAVVKFIFDVKEKEKLPNLSATEEKIINDIKHIGGQTDEEKIKSLIKSGYTDNASWDNEYKYFNRIKSEDSLVFKEITKKFKYFDPAFHSITPEGFNGRLNFLHQCTRQGPTNAASDSNGEKTMGAGNLSFGRAPYCILRIGDFYYTKICINSMSITYDAGNGIQWDVNPEGIGVQPMLAKISLGITFLGGSDIEGPIERLQNAVTANYYANTSIYDKNADRYGVTENIDWKDVAQIEKNQKNLSERIAELDRKEANILKRTTKLAVNSPADDGLALARPTSTATSPLTKNKK